MADFKDRWPNVDVEKLIEWAVPASWRLAHPKNQTDDGNNHRHADQLPKILGEPVGPSSQVGPDDRDGLPMDDPTSPVEVSDSWPTALDLVPITMDDLGPHVEVSGSWSTIVASTHTAIEGEYSLAIGCHHTTIRGDHVIAIGCEHTTINSHDLVVIGGSAFPLNEPDVASNEELQLALATWLSVLEITGVDDEWLAGFVKSRRRSGS